MKHTVRKLELSRDGTYVQTFFWVMNNRRAALKEANRLLKDGDSTVAVNITPTLEAV